MASTRREARPRGQTRDSTLRRPVTVQQSDLIDSLQKSPPKTFTQLSNQYARFVRFSTQIFVRGVTGGQGRYGRWNQHGDFIESDRIREEGDTLVLAGPVDLLGELGLHRVTDTERDAIPNPTRGDMVYNTTTNSYQGYFSTSDTPGSGVWGPIAEFPSFAFGIRTTITTTQITTVNVAVQVAGAMTASGNELLWTLSGAGGVSTWTYTGPNRILPIDLEFALAAEKFGSGTPETFSFSIRVNNVDVGLPAIFSGRQNEPANIRAVAYVALQTNDVVTFFVKNTTATSNVIVDNQAFAAKT